MARIMVPFDGSAASERALAFACRTAAAPADVVEAINVVRVPPQLPISAEIPGVRTHAEAVLARAEALADRYGVRLRTMLVLARAVGPGIVAAARDGDLLVIGHRPRRLLGRLLGHRTLRYVLAHAPCQALVVSIPTTPRAWAKGGLFRLAHAGVSDDLSGPAYVVPLSPPKESLRHGG